MQPKRSNYLNTGHLIMNSVIRATWISLINNSEDNNTSMNFVSSEVRNCCIQLSCSPGFTERMSLIFSLLIFAATEKKLKIAKYTDSTSYWKADQWIVLSHISSKLQSGMANLIENQWTKRHEYMRSWLGKCQRHTLQVMTLASNHWFWGICRGQNMTVPAEVHKEVRLKKEVKGQS